jgi:hypothetical protein
MPAPPLAGPAVHAEPAVQLAALPLAVLRVATLELARRVPDGAQLGGVAGRLSSYSLWSHPF